MNFDFITDSLACGQKPDSNELVLALKAAGITHVLNLYGGNPRTCWDGMQLYLPQEDDKTPRNPAQVREGVEYACDIIRAGGKVYVHCQWGLGRGPTMCYAILRNHGLGVDEAISLLESKRPRCSAYGPKHWHCYIPSVEAALNSQT